MVIGGGQRLAGRHGVEPSAEAGLQNGDVDGLLGEDQKGEHGGDLEVGERDAGRDDPRVERRQPVAVDLAPGDPDALGEPRQVGRGVEAGAEARRTEDRLGHRRGRALAVGPGNLDGGEALLGIAEPLQRRADPSEAHVDPQALRRARQPRQQLGVARGRRRHGGAYACEGAREPRWRRSRASVARISFRATMASRNPCSSRNSAR